MNAKVMRFKDYGLEDIKPVEIDYDVVTIESIVNEIDALCNVEPTIEGVVVHLNSDQVNSIKDMVVKAVKTIWEFIKKVYYAIKKFIVSMFNRDKKLDDDLSDLQKDLKDLQKKKEEAKNKGMESISLEDGSKSVSIGAMAAIDIHDKFKDEINIKDFDGLIAEFNSTMKVMNGYYSQVDNHLKMVSELNEDVIASGNGDRIIGQIRNKPSIPSSIRSKEFDFFTVAKIGQADHFVEPEKEGLNNVADAFNKNVPRLVKNVNIDPIQLNLSNIDDVVKLADKWHNDLDRVKSAGRLSGQYLKMALAVLEEKEKVVNKAASKIEDVMKKEGGDKSAIANFHAYVAALKAQVNYVSMYINVMAYYHNAFAKIAGSIKVVLDKVLNIYLASF